MDKEFEALDWLNDTLGYFLNKTTDTHCQITLTRNQATEFVEEHKKVEQAFLEYEKVQELEKKNAEYKRDLAAKDSIIIEILNNKDLKEEEIKICKDIMKNYHLGFKPTEVEEVIRVVKEYVIPLVTIDDDCVWDNEGYQYLVPPKKDLELLRKWFK